MNAVRDRNNISIVRASLVPRPFFAGEGKDVFPRPRKNSMGTRVRACSSLPDCGKSSKFVRVKAFPMYGGIGVSAPSLHRESTDSDRMGGVSHDYKTLAP